MPYLTCNDVDCTLNFYSADPIAVCPSCGKTTHKTHKESVVEDSLGIKMAEGTCNTTE